MFEGGEISVYYDPMIAKLSTHAATRDAAVDAMAAALDRFEIAGIAHNVPFLAAIMHNPRFREGRLTTGFIAEEFPEGFKGAPLSDEDARLFVAAAVAAKLLPHPAGGPDQRRAEWRAESGRFFCRQHRGPRYRGLRRASGGRQPASGDRRQDCSKPLSTGFPAGTCWC